MNTGYSCIGLAVADRIDMPSKTRMAHEHKSKHYDNDRKPDHIVDPEKSPGGNGKEFLRHVGLAHPLSFAEQVDDAPQDVAGAQRSDERKDPELSLEFYRREGYFARAVKVYMLTLLNSNFEEWYLKNSDAPLEEFKFTVGKMGKSGALFDLDKLNDISKNELARLSAEEMYDFLSSWAREYGTEMQKSYFDDKAYMLKVLELCMGTAGKKRRKDFTTAKQGVELISYFFGVSVRADDYRVDGVTKKRILEEYSRTFDYSDDASAWFAKVKEVAAKLGFAADMKEYKANPEAYQGNVADVAEVLRIAITGRANTPDLWTIIHILGEEKCRARVERALAEEV